MGLINIIINVVLPLFIAVGLGWILAKSKGIDPRFLSTLSIFLLSPMLMASTIIHSPPAGKEFLKILLLVFSHSIVMFSLAHLICYLCKWSGRTANYFILSVLICNSGNYPVPLNRFAYGQTGVYYALLIMLTYCFITITLGIYLAYDRKSWKDGVLQIFKIPLIYAFIIPILLHYVHIKVPEPLYKSIKLLGEGAIPLDLLVLGAILALGIKGGLNGRTILAIILRLIVSPLVAMIIISFLPTYGQLEKSFILTTAMPTAVYVGILATQFEGEKTYAATCIVLSTLFSGLTIPFVLWIVG